MKIFLVAENQKNEEYKNNQQTYRKQDIRS